MNSSVSQDVVGTLAVIGWSLVVLGVLIDLYNIAMLLGVWRRERKAASAVVILPLASGLIGVLLLIPTIRFALLLIAGLVALHAGAAFLLPRAVRGWARKRDQTSDAAGASSGE